MLNFKFWLDNILFNNLIPILNKFDLNKISEKYQMHKNLYIILKYI